MDEKKRKELKKMMPPKTKMSNGFQDSFQNDLIQMDTCESSPVIPVKDYPNFKHQANRSSQRNHEIFSGSQNGRRKRKQRQDKINNERSPVTSHA